MSVYRRMIGRELPCSVLHLLDIAIVGRGSEKQEQLAALAALGQAEAGDLYWLGRWHLGRQEWGLARKRLIESLLKRPGFAAARLMLAGTCDLLGQHREGAEHIDTVLAVMLAANEWEVGRWSRYVLLCAAGFCLERAGQWQAAKGRYGLAMASRPTDLFAVHRLVAIELAHGELEEAAGGLREVLKVWPADQTARICLGHVLQLTGKCAEAVWEYEQALCLEPDSWELPVEAARQLQLVGNTDEAIGLLEKLIGAQPHFPDLRMRLGNLYSWRGDDERARDQYFRALSLHGEYLDCHIALARHELRMGRVDEAMGHFRRAIGINDQNVEAYAGLGLALRRSGFKKRGAEILGSAGRIANNSAVLMAQLAMIEGEEDGAAGGGAELHLQCVSEQIDRDASALAAYPSWTDVRVRRAMLLRLVGRSGEARGLLRQVLAEESGCGQGWLQLGLLLAERGQGKKAAESLGRAIGVAGVELDYRIGLICCGDLEFDLAMEAVEASDAEPGEVQRRIWGVSEEMRLTGLRRAEAGRAGVKVFDF